MQIAEIGCVESPPSPPKPPEDTGDERLGPVFGGRELESSAVVGWQVLVPSGRAEVGGPDRCE